MPAERFHHTTTTRGVAVAVRVISQPETSAAVRVLLIHGGGGSADLLWPFTTPAVAAGLEPLALDLPGHGHTRVTRRTSLRYEDWRRAAEAVVRAERSADPRPLVLLGASMGGMLAYDVAARTRDVATVVATCLLDPRDPAVRRRLGRYPWLTNIPQPPVLDRICVRVRWLADMRGIANRPEWVAHFADDPHGGGSWMPLGFLRAYLASAPVVEPEAFDACPVVVAHPEADRWTPPQLTRPFLARIAAPHRMVLLRDGGHAPLEPAALADLETVMRDVCAEVVASARATA